MAPQNDHERAVVQILVFLWLAAAAAGVVYSILR
jgi:hypothetical protein